MLPSGHENLILQGAEVPFYIWYDDYPEHASQDYKGRVSKVRPGGQYGLASLILTEVKDTDRGWYNCKVLFLNREPNNAVVSLNEFVTIVGSNLGKETNM